MKIYRLDYERNIIERKKIAKVACQNKYLHKEADKFLKNTENEVTPIFIQIITLDLLVPIYSEDPFGNASLNISVYFQVCDFLNFQIIRSPKMRELLLNSYKMGFNVIDEEFNEQIIHGYFNLPSDILKEIQSKIIMKETFDIKKLTLYLKIKNLKTGKIEKMFNEAIKEFYSEKKQENKSRNETFSLSNNFAFDYTPFLVINSTPYPFITSDSPVVGIGRNLLTSSLSLASPAMMAISPEHILMLVNLKDAQEFISRSKAQRIQFHDSSGNFHFSRILGTTERMKGAG